MSAAAKPCVCPDLQPIAAIPTGPITCACCGEPLVLTCAGACGQQHVRASFTAAAAAVSASAAIALVKTVEKAVKGPALCGRCGRETPKTGGRPRKFCDDCLTPSERTVLEAKRQWNEKQRTARAEAAATAAMPEPGVSP